jgi:hypothetical protein
VDRGRLWTRERRLRRLESLAKGLILITMASVAAMALLFPGSGVGRGHGMAIGAPILLGILLWDLASITRSRSQFRADIVWPIIGWLLGPLSILVALALWIEESRHPLLLILAILCAAVTLPAIFAPLIRHRWVAWREAHVARGQALSGR